MKEEVTGKGRKEGKRQEKKIILKKKELNFNEKETKPQSKIYEQNDKNK